MKNKESKVHPTQKPVALYKWLLKNYAKPNDKILDTHVGSASSLIACYDMGFDAVGFELDKDYFDKSTQRLEDFMRQPKLEEMIQTEYTQEEL
jgi:site-specific DNA-methyltransferase (adenine-specific)